MSVPTGRQSAAGLRHRARWIALRVDPAGVIFTLAVLLVVWLLVVPIGFLLLFSFRSGTLLRPGGFTFDNYGRALFQPAFIDALSNTAILAIVGTGLTMLIATSLAWLIERTDMPFRNLGWALMVLPISMPGILFAMTWLLLLLPNVGLINVILRGVLSIFGIHLESGPMDIRSLWGLIFLDALRGVSTFFFLIVGTFRMMDPAMEEAAKTSGASFGSIARCIVLPLLVPGLFAAGIYSLVSSLDSFEAALAVGLPVGIYVISTLIYFFAYRAAPPDYALAAVYAIVFMLGMLVMVFFYMRALRQSERYAVVTGKNFRPHRYSLGRWRYVAFIPFSLFFLLTVVLPLFVLVWTSLVPYYAPPTWETLQTLSLRNYVMVIEEPNFIQAVLNTLILTVSAGIGTMTIAILISWVVVRTRHPARFLLDGMTFLSFAIPGVVLAMAFLVLYLLPPLNRFGLYGTIWIVVLGVITQYLAFATRTTNSAILQIHKELEEAAYVGGTTRLTTLLKITVPLIIPSLLAGWVWVAAHAVRTFALPQMLHTSQNEVVVWRLWYYWELGQFPLAAALGVLLFLVTFILALLSRRVFMR